MQSKYHRPSIRVLNKQQAMGICGGRSSTPDHSGSGYVVNDGKGRQHEPVIKPPVVYTQALGEDGGFIPEPDLT
jgi:hypothetical protein